MLDTTPRVTMIAVMVRGGAICTILRTRASIRPDLSATPIPIMATRMIPTGPKFMKLATADVQMKRMPSADNRPWTFVVTSSTSWVCGLIRRYVALTPRYCSTCESNTRIAIRRKNSTAGCGTAFPTRSTVSRARFISVLVAPLDPLIGTYSTAKAFCVQIPATADEAYSNFRAASSLAASPGLTSSGNGRSTSCLVAAHSVDSLTRRNAMQALRERLAVKLEDLRRRLDPATLPFQTTAEVTPVKTTIGQPRAAEAI